MSGARTIARLARTAAVRPTGTAGFLCTAGTTGRPKGVPSAPGQNPRVYGAGARRVRLRHGDRHLLANPFFHTFGYKSGVIVGLLLGTTIVPEPVFDAKTVLGRIQDERIYVLTGGPHSLHPARPPPRARGARPGLDVDGRHRRGEHPHRAHRTAKWPRFAPQSRGAEPLAAHGHGSAPDVGGIWTCRTALAYGRGRATRTARSTRSACGRRGSGADALA
ncbi:AMP-binding protein [Streptomyces sp. NPDC006274]|uniref:AMP-binding protein n=1 Tax=unclassified Streptomyces TaxID=2593676 RepID=UPI0033AEE0B1